MTIQEQIEQDVALVSESSSLQSQLFDFLQLLKTNIPQQPNVGKILSHAGSINDNEAKEVMQIVNEEFGKVDGEWL